MFSRIVFATTALMIGGLYAVRVDRVGGLERFADHLATIINESMIHGYVKEDDRSKRLQQATLLLHEAEQDKFDVNIVIEKALERFEVKEGYATAAQHSLMRNLREGQDLGLFTDENRERILNGETPLVSYGIFTGERVEFRPMLDSKAVPGLNDNFLNMYYTVETTAERKSKRINRDALNLAHSLFCASLIDAGTFSYIVRRARS